MSHFVSGIHHITAIASNPQQTYDFYTKILGLRLVKKTVNQDDVETYHLFFGDRMGAPGMDLTFFTFQPVMQGRRGPGQVTSISLAVPEAALDFWEQRLRDHDVRHEEYVEAFGFKRLPFYDAAGQRLELVGLPEALLDDNSDLWTTAQISESQAIRYFFGAELTVASEALIRPILEEVLGYTLEESSEQGDLYRILNTKGQRAVYLEVTERPLMERGIQAAGTVHHIAFAVEDEATQLQLRENIIQMGLYPTEVIDRFYFKSVYFRTPAGILFEIATAGPGFTADEPEEHLGEMLALPPFLTDRRQEIEANLQPIQTERPE